MDGPTTNLGLVGLAVINPAAQVPKRGFGHGHVTILLQSTTGKLVQDLLQTQNRLHANFGNVQVSQTPSIIIKYIYSNIIKSFVNNENEFIQYIDMLYVHAVFLLKNIS